LTWVSEGNDFRRLRVISKAGEVLDIAMLAHGTPPTKNAAGIGRAQAYSGSRRRRQAPPEGNGTTVETPGATRLARDDLAQDDHARDDLMQDLR